MDREKQKKLERERMEKERAEMAKDDVKGHEADEGGDGPRLPRKSKFVRNSFKTHTALMFCFPSSSVAMIGYVFLIETHSSLLFASGQ